MPKSPNQKLKLLYLQKILLEKTDNTHCLTMSELLEELERCGVLAERKSVYDDLEALRLFGLDIEKQNGRVPGYYVASRAFEPPELKLLVDAVQSSKFITHKKSGELIRKIEGLGSQHEARLLQRQVYVANRIKTMNESIYYNVDKIHGGIAQNRQITFRYFEYSVDKKRRFKHGGEKYRISPMALTWDDENYYMLGFDKPAGIIKHYRVDKMAEIEIADQAREGLAQFEELDMAQYSKKVFSMFGGQEADVKLSFPDAMIGVVLDRFGKEVMVMRGELGFFTISVTVEVSPQFFGWLAGLGGGVKILSPQWVQQRYFDHLREILP